MPSISFSVCAPLFPTSFFLRNKCSSIATSLPMNLDCDFLNKKKTKKEVSLQLPSLTPPGSRAETARFCGLNFGRLEPSDEELVPHDRYEFGNFVARPALLDEEYWSAAWLRTECEWENRTDQRDSLKNKMIFVDQEFNAIKERCKKQNQEDSPGSTCVIVVKKSQKNVRTTIIKSVVGTLDLNVRYLYMGETFPGNPKPCNRYGYIANVRVAKSFRRNRIAKNMVFFALESAKHKGVPNVYVHVDRNNKPAQILYHKMGFHIIDPANPQLSKNNTFLLCRRFTRTVS